MLAENVKGREIKKHIGVLKWGGAQMKVRKKKTQITVKRKTKEKGWHAFIRQCGASVSKKKSEEKKSRGPALSVKRKK